MAKADTVYNTACRHVLLKGVVRKDRTGVGTLSTFGYTSQYDLRDGFPILTTKFVNFNAVKNELAWFLRGDTNTRSLHSKIWDEWADSNGDLGPIYGKQWRDFGGVDQIHALIAGLMDNPGSRRHIVSAWNPGELSAMALPPCHLLFQCYVDNGCLDMMLYQRSGDLALGVPFNVASYSLLLSLLANEVGLEPRMFTHVIGDMHIYSNHIRGLREQLTRSTYRAPRLRLHPNCGVFDFAYGVKDAELQGYKHGPKIKFEVAI